MIGKTISHYKILEKLGDGGMGVVYKAEDLKLHRMVALKFLPPELTRDEEAKKRFIHEAEAASSLDHNNICAVHEIDETEEGQMFICMNYYEGETLKKKIARGPLLLDEAIDITVQIAKGLQKAHEQKIIHRDVKPANIFITDDGVVKILDFGLAKLAGQTTMTKLGSTLGTAAYMSPEQARGEEVDKRTDIWSVGIILYQMITGQLPFRSEYEGAILYGVMHEEPESPSKLRTGVSLELESIINRALNKNTGMRYQHIDEMRVDLLNIQQNQFHSLKANKSKLIWISAAIIILALIVAGIYFFMPKAGSITSNKKSIAVLPFKNLSDSKEDEYFSDGLTDDIIAQLSKISGIEKVIARTSVMRFKETNKSINEIGKELNVSFILEGSVRRVGNRIRIVAQLIDVENEGHIWADTYNNEITEIFAIQDDVSRSIAEALKAKLLTGETERLAKKHTMDIEAYQLYLKGRFYWNKRVLDDVKTAIDCFKQAIEKDPNYALAYAGLASAYAVIPSYGLPPAEPYMNARYAAMKALEIDSTLAEAHTVLGDIAGFLYYDWTVAEKHYRRAIELDPSYPTAHQWYSSMLTYRGRFDEALTEAKRALELDPLSLIINLNLGDVYYAMRQYDEATKQYRNIIALDETFPWSHSGLADIYAVQGKFDDAIAEYTKAKDLGGNMPYSFAQLGSIYSKSGRKADALSMLDELLRLNQQGNPVSFGIAHVYFELGEKDRAFEWLEKSYQNREMWLVLLGYDQLWDDIRSDPRGIALLKKMGLRK